MKKSIKMFVYIGLFSLILSGCYPDNGLVVEDLDLAITYYDTEKDFSKLNTFFLYDTVVHITLEDTVSRKYDEHILSQLRQNFINNGWEEITDTTNNKNNIDAVVLASVISQEFNYYYWYDYWYWYPWDWFYYPNSSYYYNYYPGYYPGYVYYSYTIGTVFCQLIDIKSLYAEEPQNNKIDVRVPILWTGAINGILSGSKTNIDSRITKQMKQLFDQSPYLQK